MKRQMFMTLIAALALLLAGCGGKQARYRIGVAQCSSDAWRTKVNEEILREKLFHDDVEVEIRSAEDDSRRQIEDLRHFARAGFDLIIVAPNEAEALTPIVDSLYRADIPVIVFDRSIDSDHYTAFVGADNRAIGEAAATYSLTLKEGAVNVLEIFGLPNSTPAIHRHEGFQSVAGRNGRLNIVGIGIADWNSDKSRTVTDSLLRIHPEANVVYAHNDLMAIAAAEAARSLGRSDISIVGIDAAPDVGIQAVADSVIDATFFYPTGGELLLKVALQILHGERYERQNTIPSQSAVDRTNASFHLAQHRALKAETDRINVLKGRIENYLKEYTRQTNVLYATATMLLFCAILLFLVLRLYWQQKRLRRQLQQATKAKLNFFTNVSHDLRTPLTLIAEPVSQMAEADNLRADQRQLMKLAAKNVNILMRLINQILDFRKYESGKMELHLTEVRLAEKVREWTEAFSQMAERKHVKLDVTVAADAEACVVAVDEEKMERVLFNLLSNAFKFTPDGGHVAVKLERKEVGMVLTVSDNGTGISAENIRRIFDNFYQADSVNPQGSGIGLALTKAFVELHGGTIEVESEEGKGTVFRVTAPPPCPTAPPQPSPKWGGSPKVGLIDAKSPSPFIAPSPFGGGRGERLLPPQLGRDGEGLLLVIDDNQDIRALIATLMHGHYQVLQAADGVTGIELAKEQVPDLIVCDIMMPGIDGLETCRRLKEDVATSHIPVLMLTACALDEQRIEGYNCGADAYLTKPFNAQLLTARCSALVANRKRLQQSARFALQDKGTPAPATDDTDMGSPIDNIFYRQLLQLIEERMGDAELTVEDLAAAMSMSRVQLYRKTKALTNYTPSELLRNLRLQRAYHLLKTTSATVSETCSVTGFSSTSYFTKCFHEYFGETPTAVRELHNR